LINTLNPEYWVNTYSDALIRFALKRTGDYDLSKDLVQDTFLSALTGIDNFKGEISEKNWLYLILKRKIIDYFRKNYAGKFTSFDDEDSHFDENGMWKSHLIPEPWSNEQIENFENEEMLGIIDRCVNKLKEIQKSIFILKYIDEEESDKICNELNITNNNFWVLLYRARVNVRKCVDTYLKINTI